MRILLIHSDYLKYKTKSKTRIAEKIEDDKKEGLYENALVVFTAVEKEDETDMDTVVENAVKEIEDVFGKVGAKVVAIYPYAHLSSSLSSPDAAKKILTSMEAKLDENGINVNRVPF
jgi:threonyl-tRNA synthetase